MRPSASTINWMTMRSTGRRNSEQQKRKSLFNHLTLPFWRAGECCTAWSASGVARCSGAFCCTLAAASFLVACLCLLTSLVQSRYLHVGMEILFQSPPIQNIRNDKLRTPVTLGSKTTTAIGAARSSTAESLYNRDTARVGKTYFHEARLIPL